MFAITTYVQRPPIDVFTFITDLALTPIWQRDVVAATTEDGYPIRLGSVVVLTRHASEALLEVTAFETGHLFALGTTRFALAACGRGTLVRLVADSHRRRWRRSCVRLQELLG